jgi:hypothetical protein
VTKRRVRVVVLMSRRCRPAAIAVAVIRDNARPPVPGEQELTEAAVPAEYVELMRNAWHADPAIRPSFLVQ